MAKYYSETIQKGSKGDSVKEWQNFLNGQGYNLTVDGDFGDNTYNATIEWQSKNGLGADGIVGKNTWGKAGYSLSPSSQTFDYGDFEYDDYKESDTVKQAGTNKTNADNAVANYGDYTKSDEVIAAEKNKNNAADAVTNYGDFSYSNQGTYDEIINKILNREKFSYDLNGDALYQQYKDKYIQQGKMAMADTIGQAAAMTGGYGNSYAASVGNQAYQASLQQLNDVIPELYQMAYDRYNQEGQDLYNQYGMLSNERSTEYGMWTDTGNRLGNDRTYYSNAYDSAYNRDYGQWVDKGTMLNNDRTYYGNEYNNEYNRDYAEHTTEEGYKYQNVADANAYAQWQANYDEGVRQFDESMAFNKEQANKPVTVSTEKPVTMSTADYEFWTDKFSGVSSTAEATALRDQMVAAVGDSTMAYELYYQWERKNRTGGDRTDTTVYRGANGQTHMMN